MVSLTLLTKLSALGLPERENPGFSHILKTKSLSIYWEKNRGF